MKDQEIFFALLRASIWTDAEGRPTQDRMDEVSALIPVGYDWGPMIEAFRQHALLGVVANVILALPEDKRPSNEPTQTADGRPQAGLQDQLLTHVAALVRQRFRMRQVIPELFAELEKVSHPVLLKGEGLAELYPKSAHRSVGDIDVYVGPRDFESACAAVDRLNGLEPDPARYRWLGPYVDGQHYGTEFRGLEVEVHYRVADPEFPEFCQTVMDWTDRTLLYEACPVVDLGGKAVHLPAVQFDVAYVFLHLCKHVFFHGGGLRQMVDWALYLHAHSRAKVQGSRFKVQGYDEAALKQILQQTDHLYPWQVLSGILHHQLGLPVDEIPFYDERLARKSQGEILQTILSDGNLGKHKARPRYSSAGTHGLRRIVLIFRGMVDRYRSKRSLFPSFSRAFFRKYFTLGLRSHLHIK